MEKTQIIVGSYDYDVCLSFAGEDRDYVRKIADDLKRRGVPCFYDEHEKAQLWGVNLRDHLHSVYTSRCRFCVMFISASYPNKMWTDFERRVAQDRDQRSKGEYILPVRFDDTPVTGVSSYTGYLDLRTTKPDELVDIIQEKLGHNAVPLKKIPDGIPKPAIIIWTEQGAFCFIEIQHGEVVCTFFEVAPDSLFMSIFNTSTHIPTTTYSAILPIERPNYVHTNDSWIKLVTGTISFIFLVTLLGMGFCIQKKHAKKTASFVRPCSNAKEATETVMRNPVISSPKTMVPASARIGSRGVKPLRILALDGGGVRGLSSLIILRRIIRQLHHKLDPDSDNNQPLLPCNVFDLICGTSTGGIIAIMLGRLRMSVEECIDVYIKLSREIFAHEKSFLGVSKSAGGSQYAASTMEEKMKEIVKMKTGDAETKMRDPLKKECCKTFVVATTRDYADAPPSRLRTYSTEEFPADNCTVWQAARATSAATTFFDPVTFGVPRVTYIDGTLGGHINPVKVAIDESKDIWPNHQLGCLLSIGTGKPDITAVSGNLTSIAETCLKLHTSCETVDDEVHRGFTRPGNAHPSPYFRFSVDRGLGNVVLDEWEKEEEMTAITEAYLKYSVQADRARHCVQALAVAV